MGAEDEYRWSVAAPKRRFAVLLSTLLIAAPFLLYLWLLPRFGELPRNDYWNDFGDVLTAEGELVFEPRAWLLARSNEHLIGLQLPLWLLNIELTSGDNRGLAALSFVYLLLLYAILYRRLPYPVRAGPGSRTAHALPLAALVATPVAAHNWFLGFSGNQWYLANLLVVSALAILCAEGRSGARTVAGVALLYGLAMFSHGSFLGLGPALVAGALLIPFGGFVRTLLVGLVAGVSTLYGFLYQRPAAHPSPATSPRRIAGFAVEYLGSSWSEAADVARAAGALGLLALAGGFWVVWKRRREPEIRRIVFWALVALYPVGTAIGTAIGRSGFGDGYATKQSRYASLPALFWIGLLALLVLLARDIASPGRRRAARAGLAVVVAGLLFSTATIGERRIRSELVRLEPAPLAALGLRWRVWDPETMARLVHPPRPPSDRFFRRVGQIPFDRPPEGPPDAERSGPIAEPSGTPPGEWTSATAVGGSWVRVRGRFAQPLPPDARVLFLDGSRKVCGAALPVPAPAPEGLRLFGERPPRTEWAGYVWRERWREASPVLELPGAATLTRLGVSPGLELRTGPR